MKILMLGWELPPHNSGGLGVACLNLARALSREGADIDFVIPYTAAHENIDFMNILSATPLDPIFRYGGGSYESLNIDEKFIPTAGKTLKNCGNLNGAPIRSGNRRKTGKKVSIRDVQHAYCDFVSEYLMDFKPALVHAHDWLTYEAGVLAKKNYGIPLVAHVHATEFDRAGGHAGNPLIHEIEKEGLLLADKVIAVSEATRRVIYENYHIPLSKIDVIYNSLDESFLKNNYHFDRNLYTYIRAKKREGYTIVSTVGRFTVQKGLHNFLHAAALALEKNPKLLFIFAGDGEERNSLIFEAARLGISKNVIFTGFIRGQKLRDIYEISDIFVMSSVSEPFGLTALEAAHHGDVLILSKQSGVSEVIWSSLKYDFWDEKKLAEEILAVSLSPALEKTLQTNIQKEYNQISWGKVAKKCLKVYNNTINHKRIN